MLTKSLQLKLLIQNHELMTFTSHNVLETTNKCSFYRILPHCARNVDVLMETIHEAATKDERTYAMMTAAFNSTGESVICPLVFDARCIRAEKVCDNQAQKRMFSTKLGSHAINV